MGNETGCSTPKQLSQTERALNETKDKDLMLFDSISLLEERLKPILRILPPIIEGADCKVAENFVALAGEINKLGSDFLFANAKIRSLLERLEI